VFRADFIERNLVENAVAQATEHCTNTCFYIITRLYTHLFDLFLGFGALLLLCYGELGDSLDIASTAKVDEFTRSLHV
jgi:hypothetical protein